MGRGIGFQIHRTVHGTRSQGGKGQCTWLAQPAASEKSPEQYYTGGKEYSTVQYYAPVGRAVLCLGSRDGVPGLHHLLPEQVTS